MSQEVLELQRQSARALRAAVPCFHCGEPCPDDSLAAEGKLFCCLGCQTVFSLLRENGLEQFYQLQSAPGTRVRAAGAAARWKFLDDTAVQERLLDFADQKQAKVTLHLPAIHCVACVWLLENLFKLHPGIGRSQVNFARREAAITFAPDKIKLSELAALLAAIGYEPLLTLGETEKSVPSPWRKKAWLQIGIAAFAFGNIMLMSLPFYLGLDSFSGPMFRAIAGWLSLALALPVVTFSAADFWRAAAFSLRQRTVTLEVPIVLGLVAIYFSSVVEVAAQHGPGYCDSLTGLIFFLLCGRLFQRKTYDRLTFERDYKGFFPLSVIRRSAEGEESIAISRLKTGDRIILRHGELLPADAKLVAGQGCIDYSFVTGEAEPVACEIGQHLYAGGRQAGGAIEVETVKPVAQSYLATLWNNEAFRKVRDNDLDTLTNRYSQRFTKMVIAIAVGAGAFWLVRNPAVSLKAFTSVLIVACPCALALAAPLTHGTVQRLLARLNIFLRNALVIERMAGVDAIVLDKTGTLTMADARGVAFRGTTTAGKHSTFNIQHSTPKGHATAALISESGALSADEAQWIASLARHSTHPNSLRVAKALGGEPLPVRSFKETVGCGVEGEVAGHTIRLGSRAWVLQGETFNIQHSTFNIQAGAACYVAVDGQIRGGFVFENSLRPEVETLIAQLGGKFELVLLSGDNEREAERFQKIFGNRATLRFNQSPAQKLEFIRELQRKGRTVMMVGDGLNDAGALKQADVGVAVVEQVGAFSPASDVILDATELPHLARVLEFSRRAARIVRRGFIISASYNVLGVSIAAAGWLQPMVCAILMPISSATVVFFSCGAATWTARRVGLLEKSVPVS